ncbi:TBPIP-domain-containing protein [Pleurotus eryngii]|uniref:TBPIP-domain-containing protein n=1 Tax=Pleurotus eryngii TaxID=5323 RepID=A0A9P5ZY81_PLEER|nr:TBPIP-domain-containing protein [Pleurotus eryngii]
MASKPKTDVKVLKGQEAEDKILEYMKRMNRPFGAVDVAANLKGAVAKTVTQKLLVSLAEKGELVQKLYGKTTFFVVNQANIASVPDEEIATLEAERQQVEEENGLKAAEAKALVNELARLKSTPTNDELDTQIADTKAAIAKALTRLQPLRGGATLVSADDIAQIDTEWVKWRAEWTRRRKIFTSFWQLATDALPPQDATALAEDLGIEFDTSEHQALERSHICTANPLKRKR